MEKSESENLLKNYDKIASDYSKLSSDVAYIKSAIDKISTGKQQEPMIIDMRKNEHSNNKLR